MHVTIAGAGFFGLCTALGLARRGHQVSILEKSPTFPPQQAASNDLNKVVRSEYGSDSFYQAWAQQAFDGWYEWNAQCRAAGLRELYVETGLVVLSTTAPLPHSFEAASQAALEALGQPFVSLPDERLQQWLPGWQSDAVHGFFNAQGGWIRSAEVLLFLQRQVREAGVEMRLGETLDSFTVTDPSVHIVSSGGEHEADKLVLATGAWLQQLLPSFQERVLPVAQPVVEFTIAPGTPSPRSVWVALPYYGFPPTHNNIVKVGEHATGHSLDPQHARDGVDPADEARIVAFMRRHFPEVVKHAQNIRSRYCFYADSVDGDFWMTPYGSDVVYVMGGGSGHAAKFAPLLVGLTADIVEGLPPPARFRWRSPETKREAARTSLDTQKNPPSNPKQ